jgi:hypothetical protein
VRVGARWTREQRLFGPVRRDGGDPRRNRQVVRIGPGRQDTAGLDTVRVGGGDRQGQGDRDGNGDRGRKPAGQVASAVCGKRSSKVAPARVEWTVMVPPCSSAIFLTIASPRPVPPFFPAVTKD